MPSPPAALRRDVEGLRALAVLLVVTYHVWLGRVSGGVDVFLFLSAFFLTGGLVRRLEREERIDLPRHWLRVFQRLVPAAAVVVVSTVLAGVVLLPETRWRQLLVDAIGSMTYVENWVLAQRAVDYYAADKGSASPLQHMWSLSLQGQVFLLWPVIVVALAVLARRIPVVSTRAVLWVGLGALTLASFAYSVHATAERQSFAYFDGRARLWEFGLGGVLALVVTRARLPAALAVPLGWVGLAGLLSCGLVLDVTRSFPGWAALWPLLSAGAVVVAGTSVSRWGVGRALSTPPLVAAGGVSYALYLVHWPVLVLWLAAAGRARAGALDGAAVVLLSLGLAWLLSRLVERPLRTLPWPRVAPLRSATLVLGGAGVVAGVAMAGILRLDAAAARGVELSSGSVVAGFPGARAAHDGVQVAAVAADERLPAVTALRQEFASLPMRCAAPWADPTLGRACSQLEPTGAATATVVVVGDSHAEQWLAALRPLAEENGWRVVALLRGACSFGDPASRRGDCAAFNARVVTYLGGRSIDLVVTVATAAHPRTSQERLVTGYAEAVRSLTARGAPVVGLRDNPRYPSGVVSCALRRGDRACTPPVAEKLAATNPAEQLDGVEGFTSVDLTDLVCPGGWCPPSVGNVWVYLDDNHLTRSYAATLAPALGERLQAAGAWPDGTPSVVAGQRRALRR
ncbi:MAG TPA: acyltransferase family protein [Ornithinibacter sp.]|nr:acyltransferase family protein [Ornithinibacter sp.]